MVDFSSYLPSAQGYNTQDQLDKAQDYAYALMKDRSKDKFTHWAQGVDEVTQALAGRARLNDVIGTTNTLRSKEANASADAVYGATDPNATANAAPVADTASSGLPLGTQLMNSFKSMFSGNGNQPQGWNNAVVSADKPMDTDDLYHAAFDNSIA